MIQGVSEELQHAIFDCVQKEIDLTVYEVFFFGSRVVGNARDTSDIDVGIIGPEPLRIEKLARIKDRLDSLETLYKIDFVDCTHATDDFKKVALSHVIPISTEHHVKT